MKTFWNKPKKENKLSKTEMKEYQTWMSIHEPLCQICGCVGDDLHHLFYGCRGADKDDRYLLTVCREHHKWCHDNKKESQARYNEITKQNWENFNESRSTHIRS